MTKSTFEVKLGQHRDELPKELMSAMTFHPLKNDEWYVLMTTDGGRPCIVTVTDKVVSDVRIFKTFDEASQKFIEQDAKNREELAEHVKKLRSSSQKS